MNIFCSDGGGEYGSKEFLKYLESKGIHHEKTNAYTPQENGVAERMNRTLVESARALLSDASLPKKYWGDAILHVAHIINRVPTRALKRDVTPFEAYTGNKPSVAHLRTFGCKAYVHVPDERHQKLNAKSIKCIHLGYAEHRKAYVCLQRLNGRILESRDIVFDEGDCGGSSRVKITVDDTENHQVSQQHTQSKPNTLPADPDPNETGQTHIEEVADVENKDTPQDFKEPVDSTTSQHETSSQQPRRTSARCRTMTAGPPVPYPHPVPARKAR